MYAAAADAPPQPVLRCAHCNKPFDKQSTLKRHGYYCRSRRAGTAITTSRPRSCIACARAKAGCDNRRPQCSRCTNKSIDCRYPPSPPKTDTLPHRPPATAIGQLSAAQPDLLTPSPSSIAAGTCSSSTTTTTTTTTATTGAAADMLLDGDGALVLPDADFTAFGWTDAAMGFADFLSAQANDAYLSPMSTSMYRQAASPPPSSIDQTIQLQRSLSPPIFSIPPSPDGAVRSLVQRPRMQAGAQRIANLILHTLKSYPLMMLRHNTLPPFIHPELVSLEAEDVRVEPLINCISLVHMISSGVQGSRRLFWKNVRLECERLVQDHLKLCKWELLAAMQALTIYVLIRLDEGETDHNNLDFLLVRAVTVIAQQFTNRNDVTCHTQCALCNNGLELSWKEWIFRESRRRLAVVYRVVNMLIYFEPATMCDMPTEFILAPLPAKRQLWEASDEFVWKSESQKDPGVRVAFALAADGELVKIDDGQLSCSDAWLPYQSPDARGSTRCTASWEEWFSGIDAFGGLVMLAASLIV